MLATQARAKINLCLHITGRRPDGYHLLDSLAVFIDAADTLHAAPVDHLTLELSGPFAAGLTTGPDNLVLRAARALAFPLDRPPGARLHLQKHLPVASGIGGGSADAAACLRLLADLWALPPERRATLPAIAASLGADVPVCLASAPARMRGIGELIDPVALPPFWIVLVNPGVAVATAEVFAAYAQTTTGWSAPLSLTTWPDATALAAWLQHTGNDLQAPAMARCTPIDQVLEALTATPGCLLARMSGSGATCFGLYTQPAPPIVHPGWWSWSGPARVGAAERLGPV